MSEKAIIPVTPQMWETIKSIAPAAVESRLFGVSKVQAPIVMLKGYELGLGLMAAFEFVHVIDSKPSLSPKGALALIHKSNELEAMKIEDLTDSNGKPSACRVTMKRRNGFEYTVEFSMADAQRAGVVKDKSGWDKYPANMLRWRAVGYCADVVFPDVVGGLYRPEELGADVDEDGEPTTKVIEGDWTYTIDKRGEIVNEHPSQSPPQTPPKNSGGDGKDPVPEPIEASDVPIEAEKEDVPASETAQPKTETEAKWERQRPPEVKTAAEILAAGFNVGAIQSAVTALKADGQDVHFPPASVEECQAVMAKLQEVKEDAQDLPA